jgi:hypothetical protein
MADLSSESTFAPGIQSVDNRKVGNPTFGIAVGASPFTYTAPYPMAVVLSGGTVSLVSYRRGASLVALGLLSGIVELNTGDSLQVTYLTTPTMTAIPR